LRLQNETVVEYVYLPLIFKAELQVVDELIKIEKIFPSEAHSK